MAGSDELFEPCGLSYEQLSKLPDETVMAHLVAGHGDAVAVLLDRYSRLVLGIAFKIVHDRADAEDVVQEVFVDLCRTAAQFDAAKGTARMWIVRTAYRRSLSRRRKLKSQGTYVQSELDDALNLSAELESATCLKLSSSESKRLVQEILATLDPVQRRILELVFFEGLRLRDVASMTGVTHESARHRYYRAIDKLRRLIKEERFREAMPARGETIDAEA